MFEDFLLYLNHVGLCTEEISDAGEACVDLLFSVFIPLEPITSQAGKRCSRIHVRFFFW